MVFVSLRLTRIAIDAKDGLVKEKLLQEAGEGEQAQKNEKK